MGRFPTGVTVVTARDGEGAPVGLTVNAFASVSLDPPLVLVCIDHASHSHDRLLSAGAFAVNVLSAAQDALARRFASDPSEGRFDGAAWGGGPGGAPVLEGVSAWLACTVEAAHEAGDHTIVVGRVHEAGVGTEEALAYYRGAFTTVAGP
ncbi:MAG: flavin reductase family protein [Longimicrobiales bacterium]